MSDVVTKICDSCGDEKPPRDERGRRAPGWIAVGFDALRMIDLCPECAGRVYVAAARKLAVRLTREKRTR